MTVSTIWTVSLISVLSKSSDNKPGVGPVAMNTVLGFRYLIFRLLFPRICIRSNPHCSATSAVISKVLQPDSHDDNHAALHNVSSKRFKNGILIMGPQC